MLTSPPPRSIDGHPSGLPPGKPDGHDEDEDGCGAMNVDWRGIFSVAVTPFAGEGQQAKIANIIELEGLDRYRDPDF